MRRTFVFAVLMLAACSKPGSQSGADSAAGPQIGATGGKGIAVSYGYGFRLAAARILETQEDHARQCEAQGPAVCRIWGMTYDVGRDRSVTGSLELRLAPEAARRFGQQAIDATARHGGMLASAKIASEDVGATIAAARADQTGVDTERRRIEAQLARPGTGAAQRAGLQDRLAELTGSTSANITARGEAASRLAATPMMFTYESGEVDQSLRDGPIVGALKDGWVNIVSGAALILMLLVSLLPWLAVAGLAVWGCRRVIARQNRRPRASVLDPGGDSLA